MNRWGSKKILNWIESSLENGKGEIQNMESVVDQDVNKKYKLINDDFRNKIMKKFVGVSGKKNSVDGMSPVFFSKGLNS
jgi:hypothetical protein